MPGLDRLGRPVGYGDGRSPSLADKVRLLQALVNKRKALAGGRSMVAKDVMSKANSLMPPAKGGLMAPVRKPKKPRVPSVGSGPYRLGRVDPGFSRAKPDRGAPTGMPLPDGRRV